MRREQVRGPWSTLTAPLLHVRTLVRCGSRSVTRSPLRQVRSTSAKAGPSGARSRVPLTARREAAPGELAVRSDRGGVVPVRGPGVRVLPGAQRVLGGLAEALGHIDVVPVGDARRPVDAVGVHLVGEVKEEGLLRAVVEPEGDVEAVAPTLGHPAGVVGGGALGVDEAQEARHERHHPLVPGELLV